MQGGVRKRGKTWSYHFYLGMVDGKKKIKEKGGFRLKGEAQAALNQALNDYENGGYVETSRTLFTEFALEWMNSYVKELRKVSTYNRYNELIKKYLIPILGGMNINDIESYHVEKLLMDAKKANKISGSTLQSIYTMINTIMNRALKLKIIKDNPCKYVERPKRDKFKAETLDVNEIKTLFSVLDHKSIYDYMFFIGLTLTLELGLRRGELGGLEWKDVNFKENTITIKTNLVYTSGHVIMSTPKTKESNRDIYISDNIITLLNELKIKQENTKIEYGSFYVKNIFDNVDYDLIMIWRDGKYIHPMYYLNKLKKTMVKSKIEKHIRFHDLRHTNASLMLQQDVSMKVVQERLGHKDFSTTANIYSHVSKEMQKKATDKLNNLFDN